MSLFKRKPDPISARQKVLNQEIATLEAEIKRLGAKLQSSPSASSGAVREQATNGGSAIPNSPIIHEPIFEQLGPDRLKPKADTTGPEEPLYNELGVRRYDLPALLRRLKNHVRGPATTNPKLVSYLAAGGIHGLRPLRYEKRVARNRFLVLVTGLFLVLLGLIWTYIRHFTN